ncbi:MAG: glycosyltransferase [Chloroflexi bacterium]|nr:glycosyltransferase [Chloroflexota bacterium]
MSDPVVTVLMAAYNVEQYISQAVESILNQTFSDFEFIIVDDGSEDSTPEILARYDDARIKVIRVENQGLTNSLNTGLQASKCRLIARMDADDVCSPNRLEAQLAELQKNEDLALVGTWYNVIDEDGAFLSARDAPTDSAELRAILLRENPFCHGSVLFRRDAVAAVGGYRPEFKSSQDYDLWLRLREHYQMGMVPQVLYDWRLRRGSVGANARFRQRGYSKAALLCAEQRLRGVPETLPSLQSKRKASSFSKFKRSDRESGYQAFKSNLFRQSGRRWKATRYAIGSVTYCPWSVVAWASLVRSLRALILRQRLTRFE